MILTHDPDPQWNEMRWHCENDVEMQGKAFNQRPTSSASEHENRYSRKFRSVSDHERTSLHFPKLVRCQDQLGATERIHLIGVEPASSQAEKCVATRGWQRYAGGDRLPRKATLSKRLSAPLPAPLLAMENIFNEPRSVDKERKRLYRGSSISSLCDV